MRRGEIINYSSTGKLNTPSQKDLPPTPPGRSGWPWTEDGPAIPATMSDGNLWPRVTIVTPSYNQAEYLEETIRSVLMQGYPNLEYIIIDGGSIDDSVEIIRRYEPWLSYWTSEPDRGQCHAINKGFAKSTGEIMAYLNSDDIYSPNTLSYAVTRIMASDCDILIGGMVVVEKEGEQVYFSRQVTPNQGPLIHQFPIFENGRVEKFQFIQPSMFWRQIIWEKTGEMNESYIYIMDREWCTRALAKGASVHTVDDVLARFTLHSGSKTHEQMPAFVEERARMYRELSRMDGFRNIFCRLEIFYTRLQIWQDKFYTRSNQLDMEGKHRQAMLPLTFARVLKRVRLGINSLEKFL